MSEDIKMTNFQHTYATAFRKDLSINTSLHYNQDMAYKFRFRVLSPLVNYVVNLISQRKLMPLTLAGPNLILNCESKIVKKKLPRMHIRPLVSRKVWVAFHMPKSSLLKCFSLDACPSPTSCNFPFAFKVQPKCSSPSPSMWSSPWPAHSPWQR